MAKNEFLPFGTAANANVLTNAEYQALAARGTGFQSGVAKSKELNTAWRQSSVIASVVAQFIADKSGGDVIDDGKTEVILKNFNTALNKTFLQSGNNLSEINAGGPTAIVAARKNLGLTDVLVGPLAQTTGTSTTEVMSQKAVTDALGQNASIGVNQLWNDVTAQRDVGVNYTNSTGRPMMIVLDVRNTPSGLTASIVYVQGIALSAGAGTNGEHRFITVVVPPGQQYRYDPVATSNFSLLELR